MRTLPRLAAALLLAFALPSAAAQGEEDPPPAPAPAPAPVPAPAPPAPAPPRAPRPPETIEQAYRRMEALREAPLAGPGSLVRRRERLSGLADQALALPAAAAAAGEDLFRLEALCFEGGKFAEAAAFGARYLAGKPKAPGPDAPPLLDEGFAHAFLVRSLATLGRLPESEEAMKAWREAMPAAEGIPAVLKSLGDGYAHAGRMEEAVARYREALERAPRPLPANAASTVQVLVEALAALGRLEEAGKALAKAREEGGAGDAAFGQRLAAVEKRLQLLGKTFEAPKLELWNGMPRPAPGDLAGKVVVYHFFAWWMELRLDELSRWAAFAGEREGKGLVLVPATRLLGFEPGTGKFRADRKEAEELADLVVVLRDRGWNGPFAAGRRGNRSFDDLGIRGLPMDVVVGRDGKVVFVQAGEEPGCAMARFAAERALAVPAPAPPEPPAPPAPPPGR